MSRAPIAAKAAGTRAADRGARSGSDAGMVEFDLDSGRWRHGTSAAFWLGAAALLTFGVGGAGVWLGSLLAVVGALSVRGFVQSLLHPPGHVKVNDRSVSLPLRLCRPGELETSPDRLRHAYFLRKAVSITQAAPVLVVETEDTHIEFPRDWFASDADQIRLARALNAHIRDSAEGGR